MTGGTATGVRGAGRAPRAAAATTPGLRRRPAAVAGDRAPRSLRRAVADPVVVAAILLDTAIAIVDAVTPLVLINLVVLGPLVAALRTGWRGTGIVSAYALALGVYEGIPHGIFGTSDHLARCAAIAMTGALAM